MDPFSITQASKEISSKPPESYYAKRESILPTPLDVPSIHRQNWPAPVSCWQKRNDINRSFEVNS